MFFKMMFLKILQYSQENMCWSLFLKNRLQRRCFPVNIVKFLRTLFFTEHVRPTASIILKEEQYTL